MRKLEEALSAHYGWAMSRSAREKIGTAVTRKAARVRLAPDEYCQLAAGSESEMLSLVEEAAAGETHFFREPQQFAHLRGEVLPALAAGASPDRRVRIWSAACSTGEEAYSLAIACDQITPAEGEARVEVFATDVRNRALLEASRARYHLPALRLADAETRGRYFVHAGGTPDAPLSGNYTVTPDIRRRVTFRRVNLLDAIFWKGVSERFDLIVCTNLLLHLHGAAVRQMVGRLGSALREGGHLMVAPAEGSLVEHSRLRPVKDAPSFFRKII